MNTLAVIPARGGSKGIKRKNIRDCAGRPLLAWTVDAALGSPAVARTVVSTEDDEVAWWARMAGAHVVDRPEHLAADDVPSQRVVEHAVRVTEADCGKAYDAVALLHATSPLRTADDITAAASYLRSYLAVVSVCEPERHPWLATSLTGDGRLRVTPQLAELPPRQAFPRCYALNGAIYMACRGYWERHNGFLGPGTAAYVMPRERSVDVDQPMDLRVAAALLRDRE